MNVTEYNAQKSELGITGSGIDSKAKKELKWKDGSVTPINTPVHIDFSEKTPGRIYVTIGDMVYKTRVHDGYSRFAGITKAPGLRTLERYSWNGIAKTTTGKKTEPDGYGSDGSPSWMLVFGII
jgi:hypothetical protein